MKRDLKRGLMRVYKKLGSYNQEDFTKVPELLLKTRLIHDSTIYGALGFLFKLRPGYEIRYLLKGLPDYCASDDPEYFNINPLSKPKIEDFLEDFKEVSINVLIEDTNSGDTYYIPLIEGSFLKEFNKKLKSPENVRIYWEKPYIQYSSIKPERMIEILHVKEVISDLEILCNLIDRGGYTNFSLSSISK